MVETTTVQGKVLLPSGAPATSGYIIAILSHPGTADDAGTAQKVSGRVQATIAADGTVTGLVLVPNDAITPAGTYYLVEIRVQSPYRVAWMEKWSVATAPDPVDIGVITQL